MSSYSSFNKDIYYSLMPRIFPVGKQTEITLSDTYQMKELPEECLIHIIPITYFDNNHPYEAIKARTCEGSLKFSYCFDKEQEYLIRFLDESEQALSLEFSVYALKEDLFERRPYKGDLHMHTNRSDGMETPQHMVGASRKHGLDFIAITDHNCYDASLCAREELAKIPHRMIAFKGEEVHAGAKHVKDAPCPVHILSLDADYGIAPFTSFATDEEYHENLKLFTDSFDECVRETPWLEGIGEEQAINLLAATRERRRQLRDEFHDDSGEIDPDAFTFALDVFEQIRQAGGVSVFCHPRWKFIPFDTCEKRDDLSLGFAQKLVEEKPFDVFEIVSYAPKEESSRNLMQEKLLVEAGLFGSVPTIGITDSHTTLPGWNVLGQLYTVIFAKDLSTQSVREALLDRYAVPVENYPDEDVRCHGSMRLSLFTEFLVDQYYRLHDENCLIEGQLMMRFIESGDSKILPVLEEICRANEAIENAWWAPKENA